MTSDSAMMSPWPMTAQRGANGAMEVGGVALTDLAERYGTPLLVLDEATISTVARELREAFAAVLPKVRIVYAAKAFLSPALVAIIRDAGLGMDVVSGGELFLALRGGMPPAEISFHGNNKSRAELAEALAAGVGKIVIDNDHEIDLLAELVSSRPEPVTVMLRVNPGVDVHTHRKISTGVADSKFGYPLGNDQAAAAIERILSTPGFRLVGLHAHVGSQLFDMDAHLAAIEEMLNLMATVRDRHGIEFEHLSPGGGFGIAYLPGDDPPSPATWAGAVGEAIANGCASRGLSVPTVTFEPGRSIIGQAGVSIYTIGSRRELPGIRTYVSVDGGMADNIRPALYEAIYTAEMANRAANGKSETVTIAGKFCESGDILIDRVDLPFPVAGDLLAIPATGAYTLAMASNYNASLRPPVVLVGDGRARVIRRRETYDDLLRNEI